MQDMGYTQCELRSRCSEPGIPDTHQRSSTSCPSTAHTPIDLARAALSQKGKAYILLSSHRRCSQPRGKGHTGHQSSRSFLPRTGYMQSAPCLALSQAHTSHISCDRPGQRLETRKAHIYQVSRPVSPYTFHSRSLPCWALDPPGTVCTLRVCSSLCSASCTLDTPGRNWSSFRPGSSHMCFCPSKAACLDHTRRSQSADRLRVCPGRCRHCSSCRLD